MISLERGTDPTTGAPIWIAMAHLSDPGAVQSQDLATRWGPDDAPATALRELAAACEDQAAGDHPADWLLAQRMADAAASEVEANGPRLPA